LIKLANFAPFITEVMDIYSESEIFNRSERLLGAEAMEALANARVIVFGIGGVGSWAAEALVRTGLGHITLVDADRVAISNINRQAPATTLTVGESKVEAMRNRLLAINPHAYIDVTEGLYTAGTANRFNLEDYDCIIDAIDSLSDKALLIQNATRAQRPKLYSSMGAALKLDPTRIKVAEFWKVNGCRLAAALRHKFKKSGNFPSKKFKCVYSDELLPNLGADTNPDKSTISTANNSQHIAPMTFNKVAVNGSLCHITAIFGMTLAGLALSHITGNALKTQ